MALLLCLPAQRLSFSHGPTRRHRAHPVAITRSILPLHCPSCHDSITPAGLSATGFSFALNRKPILGLFLFPAIFPQEQLPQFPSQLPSAPGGMRPGWGQLALGAFLPYLLSWVEGGLAVAQPAAQPGAVGGPGGGTVRSPVHLPATDCLHAYGLSVSCSFKLWQREDPVVAEEPPAGSFKGRRYDTHHIPPSQAPPQPPSDVPGSPAASS